jgi:hypothetical protein
VARALSLPPGARRLLGSSVCAAGYAPDAAAGNACAACAAGTYAPGASAICAFPQEQLICWPVGWPEGTFEAAYNLSTVAARCAFDDAAPLLSAAAHAACSFAGALRANCSHRTAYGVSATATVADCTLDADAQASLLESDCQVFGAGGALKWALHAAIY